MEAGLCENRGEVRNTCGGGAERDGDFEIYLMVPSAPSFFGVIGVHLGVNLSIR